LSKDRSKEILREIQSLRKDMESRLERLEAVSSIDRASAPSVRQTEVSGLAPAPGPRKRVVPAPAVVKPAETPLHVDAPGGAPKAVTVVVRPLVDLSLARAVEASLADTDGIEHVRLSALSGDSAVIDASVRPGVSVVNALRRGLPVAFDVTGAEPHLVTIQLARPEADEQALTAEESETGS